MQTLITLISILLGGTVGYYFVKIVDTDFFSLGAIVAAVLGGLCGWIALLFPIDAAFTFFLPIAGVTFYLTGWREFVKRYFGVTYYSGKMILLFVLNTIVFLGVWNLSYRSGWSVVLYFPIMSAILWLFLPKQGKYVGFLVSLVALMVYGSVFMFLVNNLYLVHYNMLIRNHGFFTVMVILHSAMFLALAKSFALKGENVSDRLEPLKKFLSNDTVWASYRKKYLSAAVEKRHSKMCQTYNILRVKLFGINVSHPDIYELEKVKTKIQLRPWKVFKA